MQVSIIGGGYVGLVTGTCLASCGHQVNIVEVDEKKVAMINAGNPPIFEEGLTEILKKNIGKNLKAATTYDAISTSSLVLICVGTPQNDDGAADLKYIKSASEMIGKALAGRKEDTVVAVKSTVPPKTTTDIVAPIVRKNAGSSENTILFAMNPEFLREGRAVYDFLHPDRIVIGADDDRAYELFLNLYSSINAPKLRTRITEAEMIKYTSNAFLATKISFSNEIGNVCKKIGLDVYRVMDGVGYDTRIGRAFLNAGAGFGGSCFPKDVSALIHLASVAGERTPLLDTVMEVNNKQPLRMLKILKKHIPILKGKRITVLGLAFKDNTDDIRESRSIIIIRELISEGAIVSAFDPMATDLMKQIFPSIEYNKTAADALDNADAALIMTEWPEFGKLSKEFDKMKSRIIIDGRHLLTGDGVEGICW